MFIWINCYFNITVRYQHGKPWRQLMNLQQGCLPVSRNTENMSSLHRHVLLFPFSDSSCVTRNNQGSSHTAHQWLLIRLSSACTWSLKLCGNCQKEAPHMKFWKYSIEVFLLYYGVIIDSGEYLKIRKMS